MTVFMTLHPAVWVFLALGYGLYFTVLSGEDSKALDDLFVLLFFPAIATPFFFYGAHKVKALLFQHLELRHRRDLDD